jgi:hypothetical protein
MFKRAGALASIPLVLAITAAMALAAPVSAKPSAGVTITQTGPCTFLVWYYWTGMGHGTSLTAAVGVSAYENGNSSGVGSFSVTNKSGRDGILSHEFVVHTGNQYEYQYRGWGELSIPSKSQVIDKSRALSTNMLPFTPTACP